jgi:gliding motility-associated-like protein
MKKFFLPLLLLAVNFCSAQVNLNLGLRAYYPFSGNANDVSGNNNNPVFNNATLTADRLGNPNSAYHFNGTNNYIRIPNSATLNMGNTMSVALWVKPTGYYTGQCYNNMMIIKGDQDFLTGNYSLRFADALNGCTAPSTTEERFYDGTGALAMLPLVQLNQWYSVIVTYDGTTARLYIDCVLQATSTTSVSFTNAFDLFLGRLNNTQFPYWLNGDLDEIRIYNRALNIDEVNTLGGCITQTPCNNWLNTPSNPSYARIGDLDVSGNQLTIEATYNRTQPLNSGVFPGHLVSKHTGTSDVNYALFPNGCAITTTTGYKETFENCALDLNKTYHVAMVYDGSFLKFYRNGFLHSQVACTGNVILNNLQATIAQYAGGATPDAQFLGHVNEVRIWNVARSQAQLQTYMNNALPNPTTIPGLLGYYTFDNLLNKQGNAAYNATLVGAATINGTNTNCPFIADSCLVPVACNNWLNTPTHPSTASIGNLNVTGNQITVETNFICTSYTTSGLGFGGKLIGKHTNAANTCYALSPHAAELSTSNNGYVVTYDNCPFELNKTYHVAMVYDGTSLKFYRNGFLMSQVPCSGNISTNSLLASIGNGPNSPLITQFYGYINEMRIWNVARTQAQLRTYMNNSLPNPTTQPGLLAYYTFDNLVNKQGNTTYNATLNGGATINATNPNCTFVADSCSVLPPISNIINTYTPVVGLDVCTNKLTVDDASTFNVGDTVLLIQMKGAVIDSTNTTTFGTITDYKNAGNYEFNYVKSKAGNVIELTNTLTRQYDVPFGKVQLVRVPYYTSVNVSGTLTCLPWDGSKGGVLAVNVRDTLELSADINTSGRGFLKGIMHNSNVNTFVCGVTDHYYADNTANAAGKGEGITFLSTNRNSGKGAAANGGGGGMNANSGGGGGSNGNIGGRGGYEWNGGCPNYLNSLNWGFPGKTLAYSNASNKVFMGGGGGAGHCNNQFDDPSFNADYNGGNGGGLVIINTNYLKNNNRKIISKGDSAYQPVFSTTYVTHDGMGGGGAGGTVLINSNNYINTLSVDVTGGKGANMVGDISAAGIVGPGGGGGGGVVWLKQNTLPANVVVTNTGGANGVVVQGNNPYGAAPGQAGINVFSLSVPVSTVPFKTNIDSVRFNNVIACLNVNFNGLAYTNTSPVVTWQWYFGDGGTANTQNTSHVYLAAGTYSVKLVVTDINGCKDSIIKNITTTTFIANAGNDTTVCGTPSVLVTLHASAGATYTWTPAALLNNPAVQHPVATISATTTFYVTITNGAGCSAIDSVLITYTGSLTPAVTISSSSNNICAGTPVTFTAVAVNGGSPPSFQWQKNGNPVGTNSNTYTDVNLNNGDVIRCILTSNLNCAVPSTAQSNSITMVITSAPANIRYPALSAFPYQNLQLQARNIGGTSFQWLPNVGLSNNLISNPVFYYSQTQEYTIRINTGAGCIVIDTQLVEIKGKKGIYVPRGFSPNGDGSNDRLYPILVGIKQLNYFKIYNRWGNLLFETTSGRPEDGWDGTYKGKKQPVETYTWVVEGVDIDNITIRKNGNTLLIQ